MAVVFISPKQRQKMFIVGITSALGLLLAIIAVIVFFSQPSNEVSQQITFNKPKVSINFNVLESDEFKSLQEFKEMETRYSYTAKIKNQNGESETIQGYVTANSKDEAEKKLQDLGYTIEELKEAEMGRENPFKDYKTLSDEDVQKLLEQVAQ